MLPNTNKMRMIHGRNSDPSGEFVCWCDANAMNTSVRRKKCPSGAVGGSPEPSGRRRKIQKNEQIRSDMNPRTVPIGRPYGCWAAGDVVLTGGLRSWGLL